MTFATLQMCHKLLTENRDTAQTALKMAREVKNQRFDMVEANPDDSEVKRLYNEAKERYRRLDDQLDDAIKALYDFESHEFR